MIPSGGAKETVYYTTCSNVFFVKKDFWGDKNRESHHYFTFRLSEQTILQVYLDYTIGIGKTMEMIPY